jgi:hypothetical protein
VVNPAKARRRLVIHAIAVLVLVLVYAAVAVVVLGAPNAGPTSGVGLLLPLLPLTVLGLPWSVPFWADPYMFDGVGVAGHHLILVGPAILNLIIHGIVFRLRHARTVGSAAP